MPVIDNQALILITLACLLLSGLLISMIGQRTPFPRATLLIMFGIIIGPESTDLIPTIFTQQFNLIAQLALIMVGFLIGGKLTPKELSQSSGAITAVSIAASVLTALIVMAGLILFGVAVPLAVLLGCIAAATDASAVYDVVSESKKPHKFKSILLSIVALDDAWALILFGIGVAVVFTLNGNGDSSSILHAVKDIGGGILLGIIIGFPSAILTGRVQEGKPIMSEALGVVFLCGGLAMWLDISFLISAMVLGAMVANLAKHHEYPFHAIEGIEDQFMIIFFILAGATLSFDSIQQVGLIGGVFILLRIIGKLVGAYIGGYIGKLDHRTNLWIGPALMPQAGVAIGMGLVAAQKFPNYGDTLLAIVISSTVFFEIIGPVFTNMAIRKVCAPKENSK